MSGLRLPPGQCAHVKRRTAALHTIHVNVCLYVQTRITPRLPWLVRVLLAHPPLHSPGEGPPVGVLGDPAKPPGSCSQKKGLVTHQALLPVAGEPSLPFLQTRAAWSRVKLGVFSSLHVSFLFPELHSRTFHLQTRQPASPEARVRGDPGPARPCGVRWGCRRAQCQGTEQIRTPLQGRGPGSNCGERGLLLPGKSLPQKTPNFRFQPRAHSDFQER